MSQRLYRPALSNWMPVEIHPVKSHFHMSVPEGKGIDIQALSLIQRLCPPPADIGKDGLQRFRGVLVVSSEETEDLARGVLVLGDLVLVSNS